MVRMAEEMMAPGTECNTSARRFNHRNFLIGDIIAMNEEWAINENPCFIQVLNGGKPRRLPVIGHCPELFQKRRKASRAFSQKFYFVQCLCNVGTNWCACFMGKLGYCLV